MVRARLLLVLSVFTLGFLTIETPANATISCEVLKTADGFVALRAAPTVRSRILFKLKAGNFVTVRSDGSGAKQGWEPVTFYKGNATTTTKDDRQIDGWVTSRYLSKDCG
jgi:Bacterial SH3 domain